MPKQRISLFTPSELQRYNERLQRIRNLERAQVSVQNRTVTRQVQLRRKPRPAFFPYTSPNQGGTPGSIGVMIGLVDSIAEKAYIYRYDGVWELLVEAGVGDILYEANKFDNGAGVTSNALKTPFGKYIINVDQFTDLWPVGAIVSDDAITWTDLGFDQTFGDVKGVTQSADGTYWAFRQIADSPDQYAILKGVGNPPITWEVSHTLTADSGSGATNNDRRLLHIAAHPTDANIIAVQGVHFLGESVGVHDELNDQALYFITTNGGASWVEVEATEGNEYFHDQFHSLALAFVGDRLVSLSIIEKDVPSLDTLYIRYFDAPYTSYTLVNPSLWDLSVDGDWLGDGITGGITGNSTKLFFQGNPSDVSDLTRIFMSTDIAETWVELSSPPHQLIGIRYDEGAGILYGLTDRQSVSGHSDILYRMIVPDVGVDWEVVSDFPLVVHEDLYPLTRHAIWIN